MAAWHAILFACISWSAAASLARGKLMHGVCSIVLEEGADPCIPHMQVMLGSVELHH